MYNSTFKDKPRKPLKRTPFKRSVASKTARTAKLPKKPTTSKLKKQLWALLREIAFIKYGTNCYTCGATSLVGSNRHLGHFITSSTCSVELRYSLDNLRPQCYRDNIHLSGAWMAFEAHLKADGIDVEALKQRNRDTIGKMYDRLWYEKKLIELSTLLAELKQ